MSLVNEKTRKKAPIRSCRLACIMMCATLLSAATYAQQAQPFPVRQQGPLGLDKILIGTVSKAKVHAKAPKDAARYVLKTDDGETYQLHGYEKELKQLVGKRARITGTTVGENVTVGSVEPVEK